MDSQQKILQLSVLLILVFPILALCGCIPIPACEQIPTIQAMGVAECMKAKNCVVTSADMQALIVQRRLHPECFIESDTREK